MTKACMHLTKDEEVVGNSDMGLQCLRPEGHTGPHMIQRSDGRYVIWQGSEEPWWDYVESDDVARFRDEANFTG